jgi:hypothetical protein
MMDHECRVLHQCQVEKIFTKIFYEPAAWLLSGRAELDVVGCVPFGGKLTGELEVISMRAT